MIPFVKQTSDSVVLLSRIKEILLVGGQSNVAVHIYLNSNILS
jgi:gamma-glutamyl-gamma-aminobutyrate hydrolase PuuD